MQILEYGYANHSIFRVSVSLRGDNVGDVVRQEPGRCSVALHEVDW